MGTASDLLLASEKVVLTIDSSLRTIVIPPNVKNLGVVSDDDVMRVYFTMPKTYCEIDLSTFAIRINYLNAKGGPDLYKVTDATVEDDQIIFSWLVGRNATAFKGNVTFNVCLKDINEEGLVEREFNTTVTTLPILEGLETDEAVIQDHADYIVQLERELTEHIESTVNEWCGEKLDETVVAQKTSEHVLSKVAEDYVPKTDGVIMSDEVVDDSVAYAKDVPATSPNVAKISKIGGTTRKTKNLFDPAPIGTKTFIGLTYTTEGSYVKINGTKANGANVHIMTAPNMTLPAGTYTVSVRMISGTVTGIEASGGVFFGINQNTYGQRTTPGVSKVGDVGVRTFTLSEPTLVSSFDIAPDYASVGAVFDNAVFACQFEKSDTATEYEPYFDGLRSTPVTEVESIGVNICPPLVKGVRVHPSSGAEQIQADASTTDFIPIDLVNNTYRISGLSEKLYSFIAFYDASKTFLDRTGAGTASEYLVGKDGDTYVSYPDRSKYMRITTYETTSTSGSIDLVDNMLLMVNKDTEALPYRPYQHHTLPIPEAVQALDGYGDGVNESVYNYIDFEAKQFVKRVGKKVFDGTEEWVLQSVNENGLANFSFNGLTNASVALHSTVCNLFDADTALISAATKEGFLISTSTLVYFRSKSYSTVSDWKAYLAGLYASGKPLVFVYATATPEVTDISDLFQRDNLLPVEANGTVTMVNEYEYDVPSEVIFYTDAPEHVSANEFVGNLSGTASRAESDVEGNPIPTTYTKKGDSLVDDSTNRVKSAPENSASYAKVNEIGGKTRKCTNILPYPYYETTTTKGGVTFTDNGDGGIAINGTSTGTFAFYLCSMPNDPLPIGYYSVEANGVCEIRCYHDDGTATTFASSGGCIDITKPIVQVALLIREGQTYNGTVYPMFNKGTEPLPYEPYFDGLRSAAVTEVKSIGTNLATPQEVYAGCARYLETTLDGRAVVRFCALSNIKNEVLKFKENTQYTISGLFKNVKTSDGNSTPNAIASFFYSDGTSTSCTMGQNIDWSHYEFTSTAGKTVVAVGTASYNYTSDVYVDVNTFVLNEGATALPYSPCPYDILPIPEAVQALDGYGCGLSDTLYNYIDLDAKKFVKRVGKVDMGTLTWTLNADKVFQTLTLGTWGKIALCSLYDFVGAAIGNSDAFSRGNKTMSYYSGDLRLYVRDDSYTDATTFKAAMSGVMLYYELATPEIIDISIGDALGVEPGGTVTFVNEYNYDLPNKLTFYTEPNKFRVGSEGFVGDLIGTASRAVCDGEGNDINKTYVKNQSDSFVLKSATKLWRITVNDSGTITTTEIT